MDRASRADPVVTFLQTPRAGTATDLVRAFAHDLLDATACRALPVSLNAIRQYLQLPVRRTPLPGQRGFTTIDRRIYLNADDRLTVQKFTLAHEMMEVLFLAIEEGAADAWMSDAVLAECTDHKEILCDVGAAELIMPLPLFAAHAPSPPLTLAQAGRLAAICQVSLMATLWRLIETGLAPVVLIVWHRTHRPTEYVPSRVGQLNFFGSPEAMDPPQKMRVERAFVPPTFHGFIPRDKSVPLASLIDRAFVEGITQRGEDDLQIGPLRGRFVIEAMPFCVDDERRVLSVIHLDRGCALGYARV